MEIVTALLALIPVALQVEGGLSQLVSFAATLHAGGQLTQAQLDQVRSDRRVADADWDGEVAIAKKNLAAKK